MKSLKSGIFIAVVGPSGAGKDSLINHARIALADDPAWLFPSRSITRSPDASEISDQLTTEAFLAAVAQDKFILHWHAHGLHYGIPSRVAPHLCAGGVVVANVSRNVVPDVRRIFLNSTIISVTADPEVLSQRLQNRSRETTSDQAERLRRSASMKTLVDHDVIIENNDTLEVSCHAFMEALKHSVVRYAASPVT